MAHTPPNEPHHRITDPELIQVFILALMDHVGFELTYTNVADIVMQDRVVDFIDFGNYFQKLLEGGFIIEHTEDVKKDDLNPYGHPTYTLSDTGRAAVDALAGTLPPFTRERGYRNALRYLDFSRSGTVASQTMTSVANNEMLHLELRDRKGPQFDLTIRPQNSYQLELMKSNFADHPEQIYKGFMMLLTGEMDYLFSE